MITITIKVDASLGQAMSIKEDAAMYFERYGDVQVISVAETEPEQMEIVTRDY